MLSLSSTIDEAKITLRLVCETEEEYLSFVNEFQYAPEAVTLEDVAERNPDWMVYYAANIIKGRWLEAEKFILNGEPVCIMDYIRFVVKGRWDEAEDRLAEDAYLSLAYSRDILKRRWKKGEGSIKKDARYSLWYAREVLKDRWPEAEPIIVRDRTVWYEYQEYLEFKKAQAFG